MPASVDFTAFEPSDRDAYKRTKTLRYEFRNLCMEDSRLELGDGTCKIFINARSKRNDVPPELKSLMDYLCGKEPCSNLTRYISDSIRKAKDNRRWDHNTDNMPDS